VTIEYVVFVEMPAKWKNALDGICPGHMPGKWASRGHRDI